MSFFIIITVSNIIIIYIKAGKSAWTESFNLKENGIKYIIHTVGTLYRDGKRNETKILRSCYSSSLNMAKELGCKSVAIPLLGTGFYSFPKEIGLRIAIDEISRFLIENEIDIFLVVYDKKAFLISERLFDNIQNMLEENLDNSKETQDNSLDVESFITQTKEKLNFQNTLQNLIAQRNLENSAVYSKALIDRKFFSKIISNKDYVPKKMTVMALGLALELKLDEYEEFLASAGYTFMPSNKFDMIVKFCVMKGIYNLIEVDMILDSHGENCFASE